MWDEARVLEDLRPILRARAAALAATPAAPASSDVVELIVLRIGGERYGIDAATADEAIAVGAVTLLPGTPPFYRGLISRRGIVYPLVDIRFLIGRRVDRMFQPTCALLFALDGQTLAVGADAIESFVSVPVPAIAGAETESEATPIRGLTDEGIVVVDVRILAADARLIIDDRGGSG